MISTAVISTQRNMKKNLKFSPPENTRHKINPYEKSNFANLTRVQRRQRWRKQNSPVQNQAKAVIRKYKLQLRQIEFKRLKQMVPSMQNETEETSEVSYLTMTEHPHSFIFFNCKTFEFKFSSKRTRQHLQYIL